jgi:hypothetical protein
MRKRDEEWVAVTAVGQDDEAELIAGLLQSEGIPCEVEGPSMTPFPEDLGAFGSTRVMVPPDRAEEARAVIAARRREFEASRGEEPDADEESSE